MLVPAEASIFQSCKDSKTFLIKIPVKYVGNSVTLTFITPNNHNITTPTFITDERGIAEYSVGQDVLDSYGTLSAQLNITDSTGKYVDHSEVFYFDVGKVLGTQFYITGVSRQTDCNQYKRSLNKVNVPSLSTPSGYVPTSDGNGGYDWVEQQGGGGGTSDYNQLTNIPTLNGKSIKGTLTSAELGLEYTGDDGIQINGNTISSTYGTTQFAERYFVTEKYADENSFKLYATNTGEELLDFVLPGGSTLYLNSEKYTVNPEISTELNPTELQYIKEFIGVNAITGTYIKFNTEDTLQTALQNINDGRENPFTPLSDSPVVYWIAVMKENSNFSVYYLTDSLLSDFKYVSLTKKEIYKIPNKALNFGRVDPSNVGLTTGSSVYNAIENIPLHRIASTTVKINGYDVPKLTPDQIVDVYNAFIVGRPCIISDPINVMYFSVTQVDTLSSDVYISFDYYGYMKLTYCSDDSITYEPLSDIPDRLEVSIDYDTGTVSLPDEPKYGKHYSTVSQLFNDIKELVNRNKHVIIVSRAELGSEGMYGYFEFPMLATYYDAQNKVSLVLFSNILGDTRYEIQISGSVIELETITFVGD